MRRMIHVLALAGWTALGLTGHAAAQDNFYAGKTINLIVGTAPGGGYDLNARALAATMPKYIPGSPSIVVQNINNIVPMANHVYSVAPKDGTTIGVASSSFITNQILGAPNLNYDARKIAWLGRLTQSNTLFISWHTSGMNTIEDAKAKEFPFGTLGATHATYHYPLLANKLLGTRFKLVPGYKGEELDLALERGEVGASARMAADSLFTKYSDWMKNKKINLLMQLGNAPDPRLPDVPMFGELVADERGRQLIGLVALSGDFGHSYWVSPEVPADRLAILQAAFRKSLDDPEFKAAMEKFGTTISYETPEKLAAAVEAAFAAPADVKAEAASILMPK